MNAEELAEELQSQYKIASRARNKNHEKTKGRSKTRISERTKISARTLRMWAGQELVFRTWRHHGKRGRPRSEFPEIAVSEAAALWGVKKTKLLIGYPPTKEEFSRFLDQVGLVYSIYNTGARLALHYVETKKGFVSLFVPFDDTTVNASPVLD